MAYEKVFFRNNEIQDFFLAACCEEVKNILEAKRDDFYGLFILEDEKKLWIIDEFMTTLLPIFFLLGQSDNIKF